MMTVNSFTFRWHKPFWNIRACTDFTESWPAPENASHRLNSLIKPVSKYAQDTFCVQYARPVWHNLKILLITENKNKTLYSTILNILQLWLKVRSTMKINKMWTPRHIPQDQQTFNKVSHHCFLIMKMKKTNKQTKNPSWNGNMFLMLFFHLKSIISTVKSLNSLIKAAPYENWNFLWFDIPTVSDCKTAVVNTNPQLM